MQFKHPELLYALFLLLIPIIVHLFQLRKFKKVDFTNVAFLKQATLQTRKSSQIKKWLILSTRLLLLAAIILAFAQPFTSKTDTFNVKKEIVLYLDNSFSMQVKGNQGELLKRAIQDIITNIPSDQNITLVTNNRNYKNTTVSAIKNDLLQLEYSAVTLPLKAALLKSKTHFSKQTNSIKELVFISDFQLDKYNFDIKSDSLINTHLVKLKPINTSNVSVDSVYIDETTSTSIELKVQLKNNGEPIENLPVSLYNNNELIAKTSLSLETTNEAVFSIPDNQRINGKVTIDDSTLQFDNTLYFSINNNSKINVLSVNGADDSFLKRIYTDKGFNFSSFQENQLNYSDLNEQRLIILNELESIPISLITALKQFTNLGGSLLIIPSKNSELSSYNSLLGIYNLGLNDLVPAEKRITTINYSHPLYNKGVFEKQVRNFQYPKVNSFYTMNSNSSAPVLQFEDGKPFLSARNNVYLFSAPINSDNSSFKNSPLIVPTLYNIGKQSFKIPELYYTIGTENTFDVAIQLKQDDILSLVHDNISIIPKQQFFNNKVVISTTDEPSIAGTYLVKNRNESIKNVSFNYNRVESQLNYHDINSSKNINVSNSITDIFDSIKSDAEINSLWKWFVIFALLLLLIEMLILKYFK